MVKILHGIENEGHYMSRLVRFLLHEEWCMLWPNYIQVAQPRGLFDHCPFRYRGGVVMS